MTCLRERLLWILCNLDKKVLYNVLMRDNSIALHVRFNDSELVTERR